MIQEKLNQNKLKLAPRPLLQPLTLQLFNPPPPPPHLHSIFGFQTLRSLLFRLRIMMWKGGGGGLWGVNWWGEGVGGKFSGLFTK